MATTEPDTGSTPAPDPDPVRRGERREAKTGQRGDRTFRALATGSGVLIMLLLAGVAAFLAAEGLPALNNTGESTYGESNIWALVGPLLFGTLWASLIALLIATPLSIGVALVISHYAPRPIAKALGWVIDLLAAIPSVVYGLWGLTFATQLVPVYRWLDEHLGSSPGWWPEGIGFEAPWSYFFAGPVVPSGRTILTAAIVLAIMALPIITAICREVFAQTPATHQEAALALGATRWEMIKMTVFPYSRSGIVSATLLGLGRALGETMAVAMVLAPAVLVSVNLVSAQNPSTIAAFIANNFANASGSKVGTLIFAGLVLFVITFAVNFIGRGIVTRNQAKG